MTILHVRLLGGCECLGVEGAQVAFPTRKVRALLAYLAANPAQLQRRDKLAAMLWEDRPQAQARADLRKSVSRLRQALPEAARAAVLADAERVALRPELVEVDVTRFEQLARDGTPETLERAAELYRGPLLDGFAECGKAFDAWLATERERLDEMLQQTLQRLLGHYVVTGAIDRAIQLALRLLALDPLQESVQRTLIRLYMYQDRIGAALEQYRRCRDLLEQELGVAPDEETERLRAELSKLVPPADSAEREADDVPERALVLEAAAAERGRRRAELSGRPSIAVLSFAGGYLGDGVAEDIATELGRFRELDVIAPQSALAYRGAAVPPERIGSELGTAYVLEGRLRALGAGRRITVRLIESATARQLWAERYDCASAELLDVQDEVVRHIVGTLARQIEDARLATARRRRPDDLAVYDLWLRGWHALRRPDLAAIAEARRCFQEAIARDP